MSLRALQLAAAVAMIAGMNKSPMDEVIADTLRFGRGISKTGPDGEVKHIKEEEIMIQKYALTDKTLYQVCEPVPHGEDVSELVQEMFDIMLKGYGVGLAANQIGDTRRVITIRCEGVKAAIINPVITKRTCGQMRSAEGCLSFPETCGIRGKTVDVIRDKQVTLEGFTPDWEPFKMKLKGVPACVAQHEIDHLDGITIFQRKDM